MSAVVALMLLTSPALAADDQDDDGFDFVVSLPTREDEVAWQDPGFRLELGYGRGGLWGLRSAKDATTHAALIRPGVRLDGPWSLYTSLAYAAMTEGMIGAQYALTVEPIFHLSDAVRLGVGLGFGGLLTGSLFGPPEEEELVANRTLSPDAPPVGSCFGAGPAATARLEWWIVLGPLSSFGLSFETGWLRTICEDDTGLRDPDTGEPIVRRQSWSHQSWRSSALFGWR